MGTLMVQPLHILDRRVRQLRNRLVDQVKVQWDKYSPGSATWQDARHYNETIPHFFDHLENMLPEGWVYVMPPFDLES